MRVAFLLPLLLAACAGPPPTPAQMSGFRSSSSTEDLRGAGGPGARVPLGDVGMPLAGISVRCTPDPGGLNASCRSY